MIHFRLEVICDAEALFDGSSRACGGLRRGWAFAARRGGPFQGVALVCHQFDDGFSRARGGGAVAPKALGGWRHSKLDPHRVFILRRVAEKDDISMPELAGELHAASGVKADPASLSRWLIRNGLSFKKKPSGQRMRSARRAPGARGVEG